MPNQVSALHSWRRRLWYPKPIPTNLGATEPPNLCVSLSTKTLDWGQTNLWSRARYPLKIGYPQIHIASHDMNILFYSAYQHAQKNWDPPFSDIPKLSQILRSERKKSAGPPHLLSQRGWNNVINQPCVGMVYTVYTTSGEIGDGLWNSFTNITNSRVSQCLGRPGRDWRPQNPATRAWPSHGFLDGLPSSKVT